MRRNCLLFLSCRINCFLTIDRFVMLNEFFNRHLFIILLQIICPSYPCTFYKPLLILSYIIYVHPKDFIKLLFVDWQLFILLNSSYNKKCWINSPTVNKFNLLTRIYSFMQINPYLFIDFSSCTFLLFLMFIPFSFGKS